MNDQLKLTPDEELAAEITRGLLDAQLLDQSKAERVRDGLARGTLTEGEWRLLFELDRPKNAAGRSHDPKA